MLSALHAIILGVVEGLTEFLPVSSTGHLILAAHALRIPETEFIKSFEIIIQLGAILAVLALYWRKLLTNWKIFSRVAVAFLPTALVGFLLYKTIKTYLLGNAAVVLWSLAIGGALLIIFERFQAKKKSGENAVSAGTTAELESLSYGKALLVGLFQSVAIVPGVSRSAATIVGGMIAGMSRAAIVEFSFMLAVPVMAAATGLDLIKSAGSFARADLTALGVGFAAAFVAAFLAVRFFIRYVQKHTFVPFGIYRIVLAALFFFFLL